MRVFHGSTCEIRVPDLGRSKRFIDFGPGFYVTTIRRQAERWARRKAARVGGTAAVNEYELQDDWSAFRVKRFDAANKEWLDFVCDCRNGLTPYLNYDIICGRVANDKVYQAIDFYRRGIWGLERTLDEVSYYDDNDQIALNSDAAISQLLVFRCARKV